MKVLYIAPVSNFEGRNAASVRLKNLLPLLDERVELSVFSFLDKRSENSKTLVSQINFASRKKRTIFSILTDTFSSSPSVFNVFHQPSAVQKLKEEVARFQPDVIHYDTFATIGLYSLFSDYKAVFHIHDAQSKKYNGWISTESNFLKKIYLMLQKNKVKEIEQTWLPNALKVVVDSAADAYELTQETGASTAVVPLGFNAIEYRPEGKSENLVAPSLVFSGSMSSLQTLDAVRYFYEEIFPLVKKEIPEIRLYLVGSSPHPEISALSADENVVVTGFVEDLSAYLRGGTVYVCPLRIGSGMRTRIVEALATGCAMVTTTEGVTGLYRPDTGLPWLESDDSQVFANYVVRLIKEEETRRGLQVKSAAYAKEQYSWKSMADKLTDIYQNKNS